MWQAIALTTLYSDKSQSKNASVFAVMLQGRMDHPRDSSTP